MRRDRLVLTLLWHEARNALRSSSKYDLAWIMLGGGGLLAYAIAGIVVALRGGAETLRQQQGFWTIGFPAATFALGLAAGIAISGVTSSRAFAPFLKALPLSIGARRRMASVAALSIGAPLAVMAGATVSLACTLIAKPYPLAWGAAAAAIFAAGLGLGLFLRLFIARRGTADPLLLQSPQSRKSSRLPWLGNLDCIGLAWLGAWAWNLPVGRIRLTGRLLGIAIVLSFADVLSIGATLARHQAAPAAAAGLIGGLAVFMLSLRCHPLGSPVLRTAPLGFTRAWLRLLRLPLLLSAAFFTLPASAALAAEPSAWAMPAGGALGLLALNGTYAVFAGYFMTEPLVAALSFFFAVAYANYESIEYGRTVLIGFAALVAWLWRRTRQRYYHG